ncbi:Gfo/Idh/MocA family protein [Nonomuraea soli]|uniref:Putative dehydrogenase n=1 Tax=Nonomuraea soli TaxID=1032476 RepID=A0A7W0CDB5_9ACTN|nr:Gfo/Idh/MocA family oxidoreductase [Nonomuraea soli]MBA2888914.1 putative dehydrogenase [Nonomuraea soli]
MRYAFVGTGHRIQMYVDALVGEWSDTGHIVGFCDRNQTRMQYYVERAGRPVPTYKPEEFDSMLEQCDAVIVATVDATHAEYVVRALDAGKDVICEKPLTIDADGCEEIRAAAERNPGKLVVTFNYRYSPRNSAVRRLIAAGEIGEVTSVHFDWSLDTIHGADYFRRWHRDKANSGGLLVHKSTHHFDLVNWWLAAAAETVYAQGSLRFYGDANAAGRGMTDRPERALGAPGLGTDPYLLDLAADPRLKRLYLDAEHEDGYHRDQDVFAPGITIEDNMSVLVRYAGGAQLTYNLVAHAPSEGYRVVFNGTGGRIELTVCERTWTPPHAAIDPSAASKEHVTDAWEKLVLHRLWEPPQEIEIERGAGGHGGGDRLLLDDVFRGAGDDPLRRQAGYVDGIRSVLVGAAANEAIRSGQVVHLADGGTRLAARAV